MLELEVIPERGLTNGRLELILGMPLGDCIEVLKSSYSTVKDIQLSYNEEQPLDKEITLDLTNDGVKLIFDQKYQRLKIIEIYDTKRITLKYCNNVFSAPGTVPTLELIRQCFGPTRAGDRNVRQQLFLLLFRGILFVFPLWSTGSSSPIFDADGLEFSEPSVEGSLVLSKLSIFSGSNPLEAVSPPIPTEYCQGHCFAKCIEGVRNDGSNAVTSLRVKILETSEDSLQSAPDSSVKQLESTISFRDSPQDVMSSLGAPDKIFYKDEDKMRIHSQSQNKLPTSKTSDYFFNYFTLGLDILFDGTSHQVKKFILHTNYPGHYDFNIYHRCHFSISFPMSSYSHNASNDSLSQTISVTTFTKWSEVVDYVFQDKPEKPVVLSRSSSTNNTNPFGYTFCYNHHNIIFEVMKNSHIASVIIYSPQ